MFKKFKDLFRSEDLLQEAFETTIKMLEFDLEMYQASRHALRETDAADLPFDIKQTDRRINKYEREVRRHVLTHLTVSGMTDLVPGLVLVSIVIDVERIGDYTKNIADLARAHPQRLTGASHEDALREIEQHVEAIFPKVIDVLRQQDKESAQEVMCCEDEIGKKTESIVIELMDREDPGITMRNAVALALYSRHLKRINAHLTNIASAIVNPFPRIGFRQKRPNGSTRL